MPVVVVGGGSAAFEAAVAAKQAGAPKVVMLEKAPEPEFGGNARYSHTGFRWVFSGADEIRQVLAGHGRRDVCETALSRPIPRNCFTATCSGLRAAGSTKNCAEVLVSAVRRGDSLDARSRHQMGHRQPCDHRRPILFRAGIGDPSASAALSGGLGQLGQWREIATRHGHRAALRIAGRGVTRQRPAYRRRRGLRSQRRIRNQKRLNSFCAPAAFRPTRKSARAISAPMPI